MADYIPLNPNAFGDARTQAWAKRINDAQNAPANKGFEKAGANHPNDANTNQTEHNKSVRDNAPPVEDRTRMNGGKVSSLGSGLWEAVA